MVISLSREAVDMNKRAFRVFLSVQHIYGAALKRYFSLGAGKIRKAHGRGDIFVYRDIDIALALGIEINLLLIIKPVGGGVEGAYVIRAEKHLGSGFHSRIAI